MGTLASRAGPGQAQARARPENQNLTGLREEEAKRERARPGAGDAAGAGGAAASATIADEAAGLPPQAEGQSEAKAAGDAAVGTHSVAQGCEPSDARSKVQENNKQW